MTDTITPRSLDELRDAVIDRPGTIRIAGAGTAHDWAGTPEPADTVLDTTGLSGIVTHNPGDMTVEVWAGTPFGALQTDLGEHHQRVAVDPARAAEGATLGGLFATADAGPRSLQYGSLRDLVIGATIVLADGTVARSGGHVIKNVAGYDLTKLLHGAQGTLGVLARLVLRLHPTPQVTATVAASCERSAMAGLARRVADSPVEPTAVEWHAGRLLSLLEGSESGAEARARRLAEILGSDAAVLAPDDATQAWEAHAAAVRARSDDRAVFRFGVTPSELPRVLDALESATGVTASPRTGVATVALPADADVVATAHRRVAEAGGTSTLRQRPAGAALPAFGPAPASATVLRAVAASLDPDQRFGRGRLAPWLPLPDQTGQPTGVSA
ncbi:FAD-binding oxidoreductase [Actinomycetospora cinnamomea]|uniref:Glycolate oxidase FAD binding subunit n=1 Tax=Actinomycetospora cinnamomea TaxID=663609 RepID=A0A2U1FQX2_9PSEU|nr:FAD-binding protein [Actinomycetospora cinnamomea]PVZ14549.1 glycolate oxidase FAD binding subunit [Actinomycetospora cinnamomea]